MQQNLRGLIPAKESALRSFLSECVNDPNRRHGVARAFLDQTLERFRAYISELGRLRDEAQPTMAPVAEARDAQIAEINRLAKDPMLSLIMGAKRKEIDEKKEAYLTRARQWETTLLEIRSAEHGIYFYTGMLGVLEGLKAEMDAYIERMRGLEAFFLKE